MSVAVNNVVTSSSTDIKQYMTQLGQHARAAAECLANTDPEVKNAALLNIAETIDRQRELIKNENQ